MIGPDETGRYRLEDDGTTMPLIEAQGAELDNKTRAEAFAAMLEEYGVEYNEASGELVTPPPDAGTIALNGNAICRITPSTPRFGFAHT